MEECRPSEADRDGRKLIGISNGGNGGGEGRRARGEGKRGEPSVDVLTHPAFSTALYAYSTWNTRPTGE